MPQMYVNLRELIYDNWCYLSHGTRIQMYCPLCNKNQSHTITGYFIRDNDCFIELKCLNPRHLTYETK